MADTMEMTVNPEIIAGQLCTLLEKYNKQGIPLSAETSFSKDLNIDSVEVMDLIMEIEDQFDVDIPINLVADVERVRDMAELVCRRKEGR
jgi:acyl carrier protein